MIELTTDCEKCIHATVCKNKNNAKNSMNKLKDMQYGEGPNDDYTWGTMMKHYNVDITFTCPDFRKDSGTVRASPIGSAGIKVHAC